MVSIYEGSKPFVFISYSHKDTPYVMEVIKALDARGIRVWYDAGIEAGAEWPEYIASHLTACSCVLCFVSQNYEDSDNCRRELTFSLNLKRPTLSLYIEYFQMSAGLQMQLGLVQAMFCDRFPTVDALADSLITVPMVANCHTDGSEVEEEYVCPAEPASPQKPANPTVAAYLKRAIMALEDGEWRRADDFCEQALNIDPENAQAYLGKLMAELKVKTQDNLKDQPAPFDGNNNYQKVIRFGDDQLKAMLASCLTHIKARVEQMRIARQKQEEEERIARQKREEYAKKKQEEKERAAREKRMEEERIAYRRRQEGLCQNCGGMLVGLFSKKCINCGKPKDY